MKRIFTSVFVFVSGICFSQQTMADVVCTLDFGEHFSIEKGYGIKEYSGHSEQIYQRNNVYHYGRGGKDFFLYLVTENKEFRLFFSGDFDYLKGMNFSVTNAKDFILYDKTNKKYLLLRSGSTGLFSNKNGNIKIVNSVACLGSSIALLDNQLNEISSIKAKFELPCSNTFGFNETNNRANEYDKELVTVNGETILLKTYLEPLFHLKISDIYRLLEMRSN